MTEFEKMEKGLIYDCGADEIMSVQTKYFRTMLEYNKLGLGDEEKMEELMKEMFAEVGEGTFVLPPFYANWGGAHVHFGKNVFTNFNLTLVDDGHIYIGDNTMIAPNVTIATAGHPILPELREKGLQYNVDVHIGKNVWIGANVVIVPGVTIGDNSVIGAGSVVTRNIPSNVVAYGNPCTVIREINDHDKEFYYKDKRI